MRFLNRVNEGARIRSAALKFIHMSVPKVYNKLRARLMIYKKGIHLIIRARASPIQQNLVV